MVPSENGDRLFEILGAAMDLDPAERAAFLARYRDVKSQEDVLRASWEAIRDNSPSWRPPWEYAGEIEPWHAYEDARKGIADDLNRAELALNKAMEIATPTGERMLQAKRFLEDI
jgi:hypothetical protein